VIKVFDNTSRAILRQFKGHAKAVKTVHFSLDGLGVLSGSDDTSVRNWDLATGTCITTLRGHQDYVRRVLCSPSSSDLVLSGSYDHRLILWDLRTGMAVCECDHGHPIETLLMFPSGGSAVTAGGNVVRVWDLLHGGGRKLVSFSSHQKTVTSLAFDGNCGRLMSAGLDRQLKVYSVEDYRVIHSMSYPAPVLSMAMSPTDSHLVVGMSNRLLSIKHRPLNSTTSQTTAATLDIPRPGTYRYFVRGKNYHPGNDEYFVALPKKLRTPRHEKFLRRFQYKEALSSALKVNWRGKNNPQKVVIYSLLQELARRDGLSIALSGRNEEELYPILLFTRFLFLEPKYSSFMLDVFDMIIDIYGETLHQSKTIGRLVRLMKIKMERELEFQKRGFQLLGAIDALLATATATQRHTHFSTVTSALGGCVPNGTSSNGQRT
jgi:U3 small nucleolar RNA-associated protein 15